MSFHVNNATEETENSFRPRVNECIKEAKQHLSVKSSLDLRGFNLKKLRVCNLDEMFCEHPSFNNLNILHFASAQGDIRLLEQVVAFGAAIDYPVKESDGAFSGESAPLGATALVLALACIAMISSAPGFATRGMMTPQLNKVLQGNLECAIQLVKLGANCNAKLIIPASSNTTIASMYRQFGLHNKTAVQLATITGKGEIIEVVQQFQSKEHAIKCVHCRCGSRLPWKECHAGRDPEPHYSKAANDSVLKWKFSPLANCTCGLTKKNYYRCCWEHKIYYQDDATGQISYSRGVQINDDNRDLLRGLVQQIKGEDRGAPIVSELMEELDVGRNREEIVRSYRKKSTLLQKLIRSKDQDGKSKMIDWDTDVYIGCIERVESWFHWMDLHWTVPKSELLQWTKEWNAALEQYCDDKDLTGMERQQVIDMHTTNPLAPCANPNCGRYEEKVKGFSKCARCKTVAYCSRECQGEHWKLHKKHCMSLSLES